MKVLHSSNNERNKVHFSNDEETKHAGSCKLTYVLLAICFLGGHFLGNSQELSLVATSSRENSLRTTVLLEVKNKSIVEDRLQALPETSHDEECLTEYQRVTADRLQGLTQEDLKRSKNNIGSRYRTAKLVEKLNKNQPVKAVVAGGSISLGHGVIEGLRYSDRLEEWLNDKYPIPGDQEHEVFNRGNHGADICAMAKRQTLLIQELPPDIDLFVLEFAVNDYQGQDHINMVEDRTDLFFDGFENIALCTESVIVKLLQHYPDAAIIFLEMRTAIIPRKTAAVLHMGAAQHYQVPVISYEQALWPDYHQLLKLLKPFHYSTAINDTVLPYPHGCSSCIPEHMVEGEAFRSDGCRDVCSFQRFVEPWDELNCTPAIGREPCMVPFFAHDEVHPSGIGHKIATDLIIDFIATTAQDLCQGQPLLESRPVVPSSTGNGWMVSDPAILEAQTDFLWVNDTYRMFMDEHPLQASFQSEGFALLEDKFERYGWIATNEAGGESVHFDIQLPEGGCYIPYLAVLKSYENMGQMTVRVVDRTTKEETTLEIDSLWEPRISIPSDIQLIEDGKNGCSGNCVIQVDTEPIVEGRGGNKVKIITLSVRRCIE